ncbi:MAG: lipocalin-like domain-containing protein [Mycobacterium sp.]
MALLRNRILGAWELATFDARDTATGEVRRPLGRRPRGLILYTDDGFMSAQLAPEGTGNNEYIAYTGPFHVDEQAATVRHDVRMATMPDLLIQPQLRHVAFDDGRLVLSATMTDAAGTTTHSTLTWQRAVRK